MSTIPLLIGALYALFIGQVSLAASQPFVLPLPITNETVNGEYAPPNPFFQMPNPPLVRAILNKEPTAIATTSAEIREEVNYYGVTPLLTAVYVENEKAVEDLLNSDPDLWARIDPTKNCDFAGYTAVHMAAERNKRDTILRFLLKRGAALFFQESMTLLQPLHAACQNSKQEISTNIPRCLLEHGAPVNGVPVYMLPERYQTPLHIAAKFEDPAVVQLLLDYNALLEIKDSQGRTPLLIAVLTGNTAVAELLINAGADCTACDDNQQTIYHHLVFSATSDTRLMLLLYRAYQTTTMPNTTTRVHALDIPNDMQRLPMHYAIKGGYDELIQFLAERMEVSSLNKLMPTIGNYGCYQIVPLLVGRGVAIDAHDAQKATPLMLAALYGHVRMVRILLAFGADVNARDLFNQTVLHYAARERYNTLVQPFFTNTTVFHASIRYVSLDEQSDEQRIKNTQRLLYRYQAIVHLVCARGAQVDVADISGDTPLWYCVLHNRAELVGPLLQNGASKSLKNHAGKDIYTCLINGDPLHDDIRAQLKKVPPLSEPLSAYLKAAFAIKSEKHNRGTLVKTLENVESCLP